MPISVILRVACDVMVKRAAGLKKKCGRHDEFEAANIVAAKNKALDAGWIFDTTQSPDRAMCPDCGPHVRPYMYRRSS
jgi:hypothetical protein